MNVPLPLATKVVIGLSDLLKNHIILFLIAVIAAVGLGIFLSRLQKVKRLWAITLLYIPVIKELVKETNSARMARTLSSLLSSGVDIVESMSITKDVIQNQLYRAVLEESAKAVEKGKSFAEVLSEHDKLYPPFVAEMVSVGEETGKIGEMLLGVASFYEEEVSNKTKDLSTIIEPVLMIIIGAAVGVFAIAMLMPMYSLVNYI
jgi:type IV pilus assembly protein PilC